MKITKPKDQGKLNQHDINHSPNLQIKPTTHGSYIPKQYNQLPEYSSSADAKRAHTLVNNTSALGAPKHDLFSMV